MLSRSGGDIGFVHQPGFGLDHPSQSRLPAADAAAAAAPILQPLPGQLSKIGLLHTSHDQWGWYIPLHPLQADISGKDLLDS